MDAVSMNVLDPFEVAEICVWPLDLKHLNAEGQKDHLDRAEFTGSGKVIAESKLGAVSNENPSAIRNPGIWPLFSPRTVISVLNKDKGGGGRGSAALRRPSRPIKLELFMTHHRD